MTIVSLYVMFVRSLLFMFGCYLGLTLEGGWSVRSRQVK